MDYDELDLMEEPQIRQEEWKEGVPSHDSGDFGGDFWKEEDFGEPSGDSKVPSEDEWKDEEPEQVFLPEYNVENRVSRQPTFEDLQHEEFYKKIFRLNLPPKDMFKQMVEAYFRRLQDKKYMKMDSADLTTMVDRISSFKNIGYKNPIGYILGYYVSQGGKSIDKKIFNLIKSKIIPDIKDEGIMPADVLRYGRLWILH